MSRILILADDLSGAADCGVACVHSGLTAVVSLGQPSSGMACDVVSVDADTRNRSAPAAAERMRELVQVHAQDPTVLLFKKIDSTLRGHLGPELVAVLEARRAVVPRAVVIMAPASPANGRTTVDGMHFVHGRPLHQTEMWKTEKMSGEAHIPRILESSGLKCAHLSLASVRSPYDAFDRSVLDAAGIADVIVCDAVSDDDLRAIARAAVGLQGRAVWAGSAGLALQIPHAAGLARKVSGIVPRMPERDGPVLFVIGSASRTTRQQVATLLSCSDIHGIVVPPEVLLDGPGRPEWEAFTSELCDALALGEDVILVCGFEPVEDPMDRPRLSHALGQMAAARHGQVGALVASGGETARKVLDQWGVSTMQLHGELEQGVPVSSTILEGGRQLIVATKAGDFGQMDTLLHCQEWLSKRGALR
jgi:uncharacterized protein YgbK (DUF1537 family)